MSARRPVQIALCLSFLFVAIEALAAPTRSAPRRAPLAGDVAPDITGVRIQGGDPIDLSQLQGRVVVLDFWATWCGPCRAIMPVLDRMHGEYHGRGLSVLGLSGEDQAVVRRHLGAHRFRYTIASGARASMATYGVNALPMLVVVDRVGKVRHVSRGASMHQLRELDRLVQQLLAEPVP